MNSNSAHLEELIRTILPIRFSSRKSDLCLVSLARIYVALYRFGAINGSDSSFGSLGEYTKRADKLFAILHRRSQQTDDLQQRSRLISTLYLLSVGTSWTYSQAKMGLCYHETDRLMQDFLAQAVPDPLTQTGVCRCLSDFFYPQTMEDEEWFVYFRQTIYRWSDTLPTDGLWPEVSLRTALERIEVMNRYSYMFLDYRNEATLRRAYSLSRAAVLNTPSPGPFFDESLPQSLGLIYEIARQGNGCSIDQTTIDETVRRLSRLADEAPVLSEEWIFAVSYLLDDLCEQITDSRQSVLS